MNREVYLLYRDLIQFREQCDPSLVLRSINPGEAALLQDIPGVHVKFRLGGSSFPPTVFYKIFVHGPMVDIGAFAPRDYVRCRKLPRGQQINPNLKGSITLDQVSQLTAEEREGWYQRVENNGWRPVSEQILRENIVEEHEKKKYSMPFHFSKLKRQQQVRKQRKQRQLEWKKKLFHLQEQAWVEKEENKQLYGDSTQIIGQELGLEAEELEELEAELEDEDLLKWADTLDFEEYCHQWAVTATSVVLGSHTGAEVITTTTSVTATTEEDEMDIDFLVDGGAWRK